MIGHCGSQRPPPFGSGPPCLVVRSERTAPVVAQSFLRLSTRWNEGGRLNVQADGKRNRMAQCVVRQLAGEMLQVDGPEQLFPAGQMSTESARQR